MIPQYAARAEKPELSSVGAAFDLQSHMRLFPADGPKRFALSVNGRLQLVSIGGLQQLFQSLAPQRHIAHRRHPAVIVVSIPAILLCLIALAVISDPVRQKADIGLRRRFKGLHGMYKGKLLAIGVFFLMLHSVCEGKDIFQHVRLFAADFKGHAGFAVSFDLQIRVQTYGALQFRLQRRRGLSSDLLFDQSLQRCRSGRNASGRRDVSNAQDVINARDISNTRDVIRKTLTDTL